MLFRIDGHWRLLLQLDRCLADSEVVTDSQVISKAASAERAGEPERVAIDAPRGAMQPPQPQAPSGLEEPTRRLAAARSHLAHPEPPATRSRRFFGGWLNRPRRVLLTLAAVWVVAIFDLGFTLGQAGTVDFAEMNPLAARLLGGPEQLIIAYKFGLLTLGTAILLWLRRHGIAELACWFLFASKVYLAVRWYSYFDCLLHGYVNPLIAS